MTEYILASKSPRRKELLRNLIESFLVIAPESDEDRMEKEGPVEYVLRVAAEKARVVGMGPNLNPDGEWCVLSADTIVVDGDKILGKPLDEKEAAEILVRLRGRTHRVYSGIALFDLQSEQLVSQAVSSDVSMREYTDLEIKEYIASGDPLDKAGAYAIQDPVFNPAPDFQDCFANVMGLPLCHLSLLLMDVGKNGYTDVAARCQESINYQCPVYEEILSSKHRYEE
jgi:MAF protein